MDARTIQRLGLLGIVILIVVSAVFYVLQAQKPDPQVVVPLVKEKSDSRVIGVSVQGREIEAFTFGEGSVPLLFVGGIHGGYEWNSVVLAYAAVDYLKAHPEAIPASVRVTIIPNANPDAVVAVVGKEGRFTAADVPKESGVIGRFNANDVDLNRNFDCKWQPESMWRGKKVSAGSAAFSEPESRAIRDFVLKEKPRAALFWHSQANAVYASECTEGILPETRTLMQTFAKAARYPAIDTFDAYEVTGDAEGWLASINIPAITVELATHDAVEWDKNLAGMLAVLQKFGTSP